MPVKISTAYTAWQDQRFSTIASCQVPYEQTKSSQSIGYSQITLLLHYHIGTGQHLWFALSLSRLQQVWYLTCLGQDAEVKVSSLCKTIKEADPS